MDSIAGGQQVAKAWVAGMESRHWRPRVSARFLPGPAHQIHEVKLDDRLILVTAFEVVSRPGKPTVVRLELMPESIELVTDERKDD